MPAPATVADFLGLVHKSGLLPQRDLDGYLSQMRQARGLPAQPASLAAQLVRDGLLTRFQAEQLLNGRCKGFVLGKYRLLDRLGAGGMGTVFLAEHVHMQRPVALKVLPSERAGDPACRGRFLREAQAAAALDHVNIVHAYDAETEGALCFLVMEYVDGINLQDLVNRRGRLDPSRAAHYIRQAALGLQHAHEAGLVHRDIKPANLLVNRMGVVKVLDMGLARFFQDESDMLTKEHDGKAILGTADYLAPEQGRNSHDVDIRADIYGLGATFFYLLLGRPPFDGGTLNQKLMWHQMKPPPDVHALRPQTPREMAALVAQMLAKDAEQRPRTPAEVAAALTPWTRTPLAPPAADELPEPSSALRGPRSGRFVEPSVFGERGASAPCSSEEQGADAPRSPSCSIALDGCTAEPTTNLDLASPSQSTRTMPAPAPQSLRADGERSRPACSPRLRGRLACAAAGLLLLLLIAGGVVWAVVSHTGPPAAAPLAVLRAPAHLRASNRQGGGIDLQWDAPADADATIRIERAADRAFTREQTTLTNVASGLSRWTDTTALRSKPCYYRAFAVTEAAESAASNVAWPPPEYSQGFTTDGMILNRGASVIGKVLRLTDGGGNETRSAFYHLPLDVRSFVTRFRFQINAGDTADGFTFCIQGIGPHRVGAPSGGLGYAGMSLSVALKFDLWDNEGEGRNSTGLFSRGVNPSNPDAVDLTPSGVDLHSGRAYEVELVYRPRVLDATIRDVVEPAKIFRRRFSVDIASEVQDTTAYVGFTAGTGGRGAVQDIVSWTWTPGNAEGKR